MKENAKCSSIDEFINMWLNKRSKTQSTYDVILFNKSLKTWHNWIIVLKTREQFLESWESSYLWEKGGFPSSSAGKESACNVGDLSLIPGLGRSPGEGNGCPLQYSGLENSMDCIVRGVAESDTMEWLSLCFTERSRGLPRETLVWKCEDPKAGWLYRLGGGNCGQICVKVHCKGCILWWVV